MSSIQKPDKLSHIKKSLEIGSIIFYADDYISANEILITYGEHMDSSRNSDESTVKRAIKTIHSFLKLSIFESKTSKGYRLKKEFRANKNWIMPVFSQYLFLVELESLNYFTEPLSFHLDNKSLYNLYLFQLAKEKGKTIEFEYIKYLEDVPKIKTVNVYSISLRGRKLFIIALDTKNGEVRHYIFTQITKVIQIDMDSNFKAPEADFIANFYTDSIEAFEGHAARKVVLRLRKGSEIYLKKEFFHKSQKFSIDNKGYLQIEMSTNNANELFATISKFMMDIEILKPIEWREQYIKNLKASLKLYR